MGIIVQKYGGTSVGSLEKIKFVAGKVAKRYREGNDVVVVVSAMSGETDKLIKLAKELSPSPDPREMDVIVSTGEQVTTGLLAMALKDLGIPARSLLGFQIGIKTDDAFMKARILDIDATALKKAFEAKEVAVVAGFQGITENQGYHNTRQRRFRHVGRCTGRSAGRRALRDLHRCGWGIHLRPQHMRQGEAAR